MQITEKELKELGFKREADWFVINYDKAVTKEDYNFCVLTRNNTHFRFAVVSQDSAFVKSHLDFKVESINELKDVLDKLHNLLRYIV